MIRENQSDQVQNTKALALLSGGLDSMLAIKIIQDQGISIDAINFKTPFCLCNHCSLENFVKDLKIKLHRIFLGQEFLDLIVDPPHGHGSQMNPCIDCRIFMLKKAKDLAKQIGADFIMTGEVLNQRPFSQRKKAMIHIEREADLEGKILRPLSARLLPMTEPEKKGLVDRELLLEIIGRRRLPQINLAKKVKLKDYPCPSGGCLLTDPRFSDRLREHLKYKSNLTLEDVALLKIGRHFRKNENKIIVGRNEKENNKLLMIAKKRKIAWFEAIDYFGPIGLLLGNENPDTSKIVAGIVARYSDASQNINVRISSKGVKEEILEVKSLSHEVIESLMI
jgi:tRNA U34 2-thiouridine synthase MnmA/TrmU